MLVSGRVDLKSYWGSSPSDTHWETYIVVTSFKYRENRGTPGIELFIRGLVIKGFKYIDIVLIFDHIPFINALHT